MKKLLISAFVLLFQIAFVFSQQQNVFPPKDFRGELHQAPDGSKFVQLKWERPDVGLPPHFYKIYASTINSKPYVIGQVGADSVKDSYEFIARMDFESGKITFWATSCVIQGNKVLESSPSQFVEIEIPFEAKIVIISQPPKVAYLGKLYRYQVQFKTNANCVIDKFELTQAPEGMTISEKGLVEWTPQETGLFDVEIKVSSTKCQDVKPAHQKFTLRVVEKDSNSSNNPYVRIVSPPNSVAYVNQEWNFRILVESNIRCPVEVGIIGNLPKGIKLNKDEMTLTGIIEEEGNYTFVIFAILTCDTNVRDYQQFILKVTEKPANKHCGEISGMVNYQDQEPVPNGIVRAWKANSNDPDYRYEPFIQSKIIEGKFELYLPKGQYILEFFGETFERVLYNNAKDFTTAFIFEISCSDSTKSKFDISVNVVRKGVPENYFVTGKVYDSSTLDPVMAVVEFLPIEFIKKDIRRDAWGNNVFVTKTNQNGEYSIKLPEGYYIAHAVPIEKNKFYDQFYKDAPSPFTADVIEVFSDVNGIDFHLKKPAENKGGFTGFVSDSARNPIQAFVYAYLIEPAKNSNAKPYYYQVEKTNQEGYFTFNSLPPGLYVLFSVPLDRKFVPGYYKQGDFVALKWSEATKIGVGEVMIDMVFHLMHKERKGKLGLIRIEGFVHDGFQKTFFVDIPLGYGNPVDEAFVVLSDSDGEFSEFAMTNKSGFFSFIEAPPEYTTILVSKPGYYENEIPVTLDYNRSGIVQIEVPVEKVYLSVTENLNTNFNIIQSGNEVQIFAFDESIRISYVVVYNSFGCVVLTETFDEIPSVKINLEQLPQGVYFAKVKSSVGNLIFKFSFVK